MNKIKVGVVGTGFIGPAHIEALRRLPNVEVAALCEVTIELAEAKAKQLGIDRWYIFEDLLKQDDIQSVHICTPNFLHYAQSKAALLAGKHVICETFWMVMALTGQTDSQRPQRMHWLWSIQRRL